MAAIGDPGRTIRADYNAMRGRALPKRNPLDATCFGIEATEHAGELTSVPDSAVRRGRHVMWMVSCLHRKILHLSRAGRKRLHDQQPNENNNGNASGPHAADLEFHCEEMKATPPSRALGSKMSALGHSATPVPRSWRSA